MRTLTAPKINTKAIAKLNKALLLTDIDGMHGLSVGDDNTFTLTIREDGGDPVRVRICVDYILDACSKDLATDILHEHGLHKRNMLGRMFNYPDDNGIVWIYSSIPQEIDIKEGES